jgi:hypothetical protein
LGSIKKESMTKLNNHAIEYDALHERSKRMAERVEALRSLEPANRSRIMASLQKLWVEAEEQRVKADDDCGRAMAKILENAVKGGASNPAFAKLRQTAGRHALHAQTVIVSSAVSPDRAREAVATAFAQRAGKLVFPVGANKKERAYNGLLALGEILRARAYAYATLALWDAMPTMDTLTITDLRLRIDDALSAFSADDAVHELKEISKSDRVQSDSSLARRMTNTETGDHSVLIPEHFEKAIVKPGDGITQTLARIIVDNPRLYGYHGVDDELSIDLFARRLAQEAVQNDGLLRLWFTEGAVGKLAVIPVRKSDGFHLLFLDAHTQEEISSKALKSYTKAKPRI